MFYKRPSLRRGGTPTGIEQLSPRVQAKSGFMGLNFGVRQGDNTGYQDYMNKVRADREAGNSGIAQFFNKYIAGPRFTNPGFESPFGNFFSNRTGFEFMNLGAQPSGDRVTLEDLNTTTTSKKGVKETNILEGQEDTEGRLTGTGLENQGGGADFSTIVNKVVPNKKPKIDEPEIIIKGKEEEIRDEAAFLDELTGAGISKGEAALILAKGIGQAGSIGDKAKIISDELLNVAADKRKLKQRNVLRAYEAYKTKEANQSKLNNTEKSVQAYVTAALRDPNNKKTRQALELEAWNKILGGQTDDRKYYQAYLTTNRFEIQNARDVIGKLEGKENLSKREQTKLDEAKKVLTIAEQAAKPGGVSVYATGGRVGLKDGTPPKEEIEATEVVENDQSVPMKPVEKLDYTQLRNRLPEEISDDIVQLLSNSQEALADFAYIRTQDDVGAFNSKYGVNLILPPNTI